MRHPLPPWEAAQPGPGSQRRLLLRRRVGGWDTRPSGFGQSHAPPQEPALVRSVWVQKYGEVTPHPSLKVLCLKAEGRFFFSRDNKDTLSLCALPWCKSLIASGDGGSSVPSNPSASLQAARPPLIRKIQLFVYIHFPHSDYFINCPAFISSLPIPPNNQFFYPDQQTHHRSFVDSKDLLSLLKEPLFFDDWVAANFKAINLSSDWLAAQQSPYQILGGDSEALRPREGRASGARVGRTGRHAGRPFILAFGCPCLGGGRVPLHGERPSSSSHGRCGRPPERLTAGLPPGQGRARSGREQVGMA